MNPTDSDRTRVVARRSVAALIFALSAASCSTLPTNEIAAEGDGQATTTTYVTMPPTTSPPTTSPATTDGEATTLVPTTLVPTTQVPTTQVPTTAAPTTVAPTTVAPTTAAPTTVAPTTVPAGADPLEELPYTGPSEAVLFALIGLAMIVAGRSVLDLFGLLTRITPTGENLPPR